MQITPDLAAKFLEAQFRIQNSFDKPEMQTAKYGKILIQMNKHMHKYSMGKKLSVSRRAEKDLVGMVTIVKTTVKKTNGVLGYANSSFCLWYRLRHCIVLQ